MSPQARADLSGRRVLVVEDDYWIAEEMAGTLTLCGAEVVGPAANVEQADALIAAEGDRLDCAVLDLNLSGEMVFPVADALRDKGIPFVFATGYDSWKVPERFADVPLCEKPVDVAKVSRALAG